MSYARIDENQREIVKVLRDVGCTVQSIAEVGKGCPDLLVGVSGINLLFEIKDGKKPPSQKKLTPMEEDWLRKWRGLVYVIESKDEALEVINLNRSRQNEHN